MGLQKSKVEFPKGGDIFRAVELIGAKSMAKRRNLQEEGIRDQINVRLKFSKIEGSPVLESVGDLRILQLQYPD